MCKYLVLYLFLVVMPSVAFSQWEKIDTSPYGTNVIMFLDEQGASSTGFIGGGEGGVILKTTDDGKTWRKVNTPVGVNGGVCAFAFKDSKIGWAVFRPGKTPTTCLRTFDGGENWEWTGVFPLLAEYMPEDVYYNPQTQRLFISVWYGKNLYSTDLGDTWQLIPAQYDQGYNGIAFSTPNSGIIATGNGSFQPSLYTEDGGITWYPSDLTDISGEYWEPLAIKNTSLYFAIHDGNSTVYRSLNGGKNWTRTAQIKWNGSLSPASGWIGMDDCGILYTHSYPGTYVSADSGFTWTLLDTIGSAIDARATIHKNKLYNVGGQQVFVYTKPSKLSLSDTAISLTIPNTCNTADTFVTVRNYFCDPIKIQSISLIDSSLFSIGAISTPVYKEFRFNDVIYIPIHVQPKKPGMYSTKLILTTERNGRSSSVAVNLSVKVEDKVAQKFILSKDKIAFGQVEVCQEKQEKIFFQNTSCDTLLLRDALIKDGGPYTLLSSHGLPLHLAPGETDTITVIFAPNKPNAYNTALKLGITLNDKDESTSIAINGNAIWKPSQILTTKTERFDSVSLCEQREQVVYLHNPSCDSLEVVQLYSSLSGDFEIVEPKTPLWVGGKDSLRVVVRYNPKKEGSQVDSFEVRAHYTFSSDQSIYVKLLGEVIPSRKSFTFNTDNLKLDSLSLCNSYDTSIVLYNKYSCDTLHIVSIAGQPKEMVALQDTSVNLGQGDSIVLKVRITPKDGLFTGNIILSTSSGDTSLPITLSTKPSGGEISLSTLVLTLPNVIYQCSSSKGQLELTNAGCGSVVIDSIVGLGKPFKLLSSLGYSLAQDSSAIISVASDGMDVSKAGLNQATPIIYYHGDDGISKNNRFTIVNTVVDPPTIGVAFKGSQLHAFASDTITLPVYLYGTLNKETQNIGPSELKVTIEGNTDLLTPILIKPVIQTQRVAVGSLSKNQFTFTASVLPEFYSSLNDTLLWCNLKFGAFLTDSTSTLLKISAVDPIIINEHCVVPDISDSKLQFDLSADCTDSILIGAMRGKTPLIVQNIRPNPSAGALLIEFGNMINGLPIRYEVCDVLGRTLQEGQLTNPREILNLQHIPSGNYHIRFSDGYSIVTKKIDIQR